MAPSRVVHKLRRASFTRPQRARHPKKGGVMRLRNWTINLVMLLVVAQRAAAQTPTPTPVDSNIAVTNYAQNHGVAPCASRGDTGCGGCYPGPIPPSDPILAAL